LACTDIRSTEIRQPESQVSVELARLINLVGIYGDQDLANIESTGNGCSASLRYYGVMEWLRKSIFLPSTLVSLFSSAAAQGYPLHFLAFIPATWGIAHAAPYI
jgi:hypothetical protein